MKYFVFILMLISGVAYGQTTYYIRADSTRLTKNGGSNELIIENDTRDSLGVLVNIGKGRTAFQRARVSGDTLFLGRDTIIGVGSGGGGFDQIITPTTITSNQNNYAPTGFNASGSILPVTLRLSSDAARTITGLSSTGFAGGKTVIIQNVGSNNITLSYLNGSSSAANRFYFVDSDIVLREAGSITLVYDDTDNIWRTLNTNLSITPGYGVTSSTGLAQITSVATVRVDTTSLKSQYWGRHGSPSLSNAFIGNTDSADLHFRINGIRAGWINTAPGGSGYGANTMFGFRSGASSLTASGNTIFGYYAFPSSTGTQNTMMGAYSGVFATNTAAENVGIGTTSLASVQGIRNVAVGSSTMPHGTTIEQNTTVGNYSTLQIRTGDFSTAVGSSALRGIVDGSYNTAIGAIALTQATTAIASIAVTNGGSGYTTATVVIPAPTVGSDPNNNSLQATATATINSGAISSITITQPGKGYTGTVTATITGDGTGATLSVTLASAEGNTAIGAGSLSGVRTGVYNIGVGYYAGSAIVMGSYNVVIGSYTASSFANASKRIYIADGEGTLRQMHDSSAGGWYVPDLTTAPGTRALRYDPATDKITLGDTLSGGGGGGTPGGVEGSVQINDGAGGFTGDAAFTYVNADGLAQVTIGEGDDDGMLTLRQTSGAVNIQSAAAGSWTWTLPGDDGTANWFMRTDGSGGTTWADPFASPALTGTPTAPTASAGTNTTQIATTAFTVDQSLPDHIKANNALGGTWKATSVGVDIQNAAASTSLTDGQVKFIGVYLEKPQTLTGVKVYVRTLGNYTGDNNNKVGLYSYSGGTMTLVASSTNSGTLWTSAANAYQTIAFSSTYAAAAGMYFVGMLYNHSIQTTAPALAGQTISQASMGEQDFTNSAKMYSAINGQTDLPATQAMTGVAAQATTIWCAVY